LAADCLEVPFKDEKACRRLVDYNISRLEEVPLSYGDCDCHKLGAQSTLILDYFNFPLICKDEVIEWLCKMSQTSKYSCQLHGSFLFKNAHNLSLTQFKLLIDAVGHREALGKESKNLVIWLEGNPHWHNEPRK
jgi:hypothetical protein